MQSKEGGKLGLRNRRVLIGADPEHRRLQSPCLMMKDVALNGLSLTIRFQYIKHSCSLILELAYHAMIVLLMCAHGHQLCLRSGDLNLEDERK